MKFIQIKILLSAGFVLFFCTQLVSQKNWYILESSLFKIYYAENDDKIAKELSTFLPKSYTDLAHKLRVKLTKSVSVFLCPTAQIFDELTGKLIPHWGEGVADPVRNIIIIKSPNLSNNLPGFPKLVLHELTHILVGQSVKHPKIIPRWFNEGVAIYFSDNQDFASGQAISKALITNSLVPLDEIDDVLNFQKEKARLAYEESYSAVLFLEEQFGYEAFIQFIQSLKTGSNFNQIFLDVFGVDFIDFEWEWNQYVEKKYRWRFLLDFGTYLWIIILLLFILVFIAIKFRNRKILKQWENEQISNY